MIHIITIGSDLTKLKYLNESIDYFSQFSNIKLTVINHQNWSNGNIQKIFVLKKFVTENTTKDDIICFIDAYDVIVNSINMETELLEKFKNKNCNLLFSAEMNCFPSRYKKLYPKIKHNSNHKYLNSGGFIGYQPAILDALNWKSDALIIKTHKDHSDQGYFTEYYFKNNRIKNIKLDTNADIFLSMHLVDHNDIIFQKNQTINKSFNNKPCFIHFNGHSFNNIDNMMGVFIQNIIKSADSDDPIELDKKYKTLNKCIQQK